MSVYTEHYGKFAAVLGAGAIIGWISLTAGFGYHGPGIQKELQAKARVAMAVEVCEGQLRTSPNAAAVFVELQKAASTYDRGNIIEKGKWHLMPGQTSSIDYQVARDCGDLAVKNGPPKVVAQKS